jgi:hypothetical protein
MLLVPDLRTCGLTEPPLFTSLAARVEVLPPVHAAASLALPPQLRCRVKACEGNVPLA